MKRVAGGDAGPFEELVRRYQDYVINVVYKFFGRSVANRADFAEDLAQEVFLKVFNASKGYTPSAKFSTYLYRVTANLCLNKIRDEKRRRDMSLDTTPGGDGGEPHAARVVDNSVAASPAEALLKAELAEKVAEALDALPDKQRLAIILYRYDELSYQEIANVLGTTIPAVKSLIFRARAQLAELLRPYVGP